MQQVALEKHSTQTILKDIFSVKGWLFFAAFSAIYVFTNYFLRTGIVTDEMYYNSFADQLSSDNIQTVVDMQNRIGFISYLIIPFVLIIKLAAVSACIYTAMLLTGNEKKLTFSAAFRIALFAEIVFVVSALLRLILLTVFHQVETLAELQAFAPLSVYSLFPADAIPSYLVYPLQSISLFEVAYIVLLAAGVQYHLRNTFDKSLTLILASYGTGLLCWMAFITFLRLNAGGA